MSMISGYKHINYFHLKTKADSVNLKSPQGFTNLWKSSLTIPVFQYRDQLNLGRNQYKA